MKVFINDQGEVVGTVTGASKDVEDKMEMPDAEGKTIPTSLAIQISNPKNPLQARHLKMKDCKIEEMSPKEKEKADDTYNERNQRLAEINSQARPEARGENSSS